MTSTKTPETTKLREEEVRKIESKVKSQMSKKIAHAISSDRHMAYHDKLRILRAVREALSED